MRFIPSPPQNQDGAMRFNIGMRPADELLPPSMLALVNERDKLTTALYAARQTLSDITHTDRDTAATVEDDAAAADAARAGRPIPEPKAVPKLTADRAAAARAVKAQEAAHAAVSADCASHASLLHEQRADDAVKAKVKHRAQVGKLADQLAAAVESAVAAGATEDWLAGQQYEPRAQVRIINVIPESSRGQDIGHHLTGAAFTVRELITNAALTVLENDHV